MRAAVRLLDRAARLRPPDDPQRLRLLPSLGRALVEVNEWKRAGVVLSEALEAGEPGVAADAAVAHAYVRLHTDPESSHAKARAELDAAIRVFEEIGDEAGLARALSIGGLLRFWRGDAAGAIEEYERGARLARNAGDRPQEIQDLQFVLLAVVCGPDAGRDRARAGRRHPAPGRRELQAGSVRHAGTRATGRDARTLRRRPRAVRRLECACRRTGCRGSVRGRRRDRAARR